MSLGSDWASTLVASWQQPRPDALARALQPLSWLYRAALGMQRALVTSGVRVPQRAPRPLVVVGNLIAGGAGKTPTVIALVALLRQLGWHPGVISRGYGRNDSHARLVDAGSDAARVGDEPLLIHLRTRAPVAVAQRRLDAAELLCRSHPEVSMLIADDGLQHRALARDAQIIVFDERGVGNGLLLPAGPLREPLPDAVPARTLVVYNAALASTRLPGTLAERSLTGVVELAPWWQGAAADAQGWDRLRGRRLFACAGTAVPERFFAMLRQHGLDIEPIVQPDHVSYDVLPWPEGAADVVLTEKDAVKIPPRRVAGTRVWVVPLDLRLDASIGPALARWLPAPT